MAKQNSSIFGKALKLWLEFKAGKSAVKLISGPALVGGVGYLLFRKFRGANSAAI